MALQDWVRDERGSRYQLIEELGSGAIAVVYRGRPAQGPEDGALDVAAKVPLRLLSRDLLGRFWSEHDILRDLGQNADKKGWGHLFPRAWRGYAESGGTEVLLMDLARGERLVSLAAASGGRLPEPLGLAAGLQYAQLLLVLHDDAHMSCVDRKPNDFYWQGDERSGKLMVLDWNVVRQGKEQNVSEDIFVFGRIWYELLLGSPPVSGADRVGRDITAHRDWEELSYGTRAILRQALQSDPSRRQESAAVLMEQIQLHWQDWQEPAGYILQDRGQRNLSTARQTHEEAQKRLRRAASQVKGRLAVDAGGSEIESELDEAKRLVQQGGPALLEALRLLDLAHRKGGSGAERLLGQAAGLADQRTDLLVEGCRQLELIQYSAASLWLEVAQESVADDAHARLRVSRWATLAQAGREAIGAGGGIKDQVAGLTTIARHLEDGRDRWRDAEEAWQSLSHKLNSEWPPDSRVGQLLGSLAGEAAFWRDWSQAVDSEQGRRFERAAEGYRSALRDLDRIAYRDDLAATLPADLTERIDDCANLAATEGRVQQYIDEGLRLMGEPDLQRADLLGVRRAKRRGLALAAGDRSLVGRVEDALGSEELLSLLLRLKWAHGAASWLAAIGIVGELAQRFPAHTESRRWTQQVIADAYAIRNELRPGAEAVAIITGLRDLRPDQQQGQTRSWSMTDEIFGELDTLIGTLSRKSRQRDTLLEKYREGRELERQGKAAEAVRTMLDALEVAREQQLELFDGVPVQNLLGLVEAVTVATEWEEKATRLARSLPKSLDEIRRTRQEYETIRGDWDGPSAFSSADALDDAETWTRRVKSIEDRLSQSQLALYRQVVHDRLLKFNALLASGEPFRAGTPRLTALLAEARLRLKGLPQQEATRLEQWISDGEKELRTLQSLSSREAEDVERWRSQLALRQPLSVEDHEALQALAERTISGFLADLSAQSRGLARPQQARSDAIPSSHTYEQWSQEWVGIAATGETPAARKRRLEDLDTKIQARADLQRSTTGAIDPQLLQWRTRLHDALLLHSDLDRLQQTENQSQVQDAQGIRSILDQLHDHVANGDAEVFALFAQDWMDRFFASSKSYLQMLGKSRARRENLQQTSAQEIAREILMRYSLQAAEKAALGRSRLQERMGTRSPESSPHGAGPAGTSQATQGPPQAGGQHAGLEGAHTSAESRRLAPAPAATSGSGAGFGQHTAAKPLSRRQQGSGGFMSRIGRKR